ncbi:MAG TPA: glycoside hydrolase family 3 C-terminal domain-containing protein, partial [Phycisphaerae bacterium]|nr:glycoside hydrolase family 3 C-terminal domain-containing protein [Phycisphaerae bacterium]
YKDISLPFDKRVADLVSRMTLQEKSEQVQYLTLRNTELDIPPACWWTEAIHGISRAGTATVFPQAIGMAASWDPPLIHQVGDAIGDEARAKLNPSGTRYQGIIMWAPTINMARDPRWGRVEETYGEDPFLTGRLAVEFCKGLQGDDPKYLKTVATPKHFAVHSQESGRMNRSFDVPDTLVHDYYLPAFRDCFVEAHAQSVMTAFSGYNQIPSTANFNLLTNILRRDWGFDGAVTTDWGAVMQLYNGHHYVNSDHEAIAAAINAGVDVISDQRSDTRTPNNALVNAIVATVKENLLREDILTRAVSRNLMVRFRLGLFDPPDKVPFTPKHPFDPKIDCHPSLALKMAQECFVLLKNDPAPKGYGFRKLLPLDLRTLDSIAILGPNANNFYYGAYSGSPSGAAPKLADAIKAAAGDRLTIRTDLANNIDDSVDAALKSDVVIFACGLNETMEHEGSDRSQIRLPDAQQNLLEKIVRVNPNVVVVLQGGSPIGMQWIKEHVPAALMLWYPGEQGGVAAAQILLGQVNPSGRLPLTFYQGVTELPPLDDYDITKGRTYMYYQKQPAPCYVFGYGMSFTTFEYRNLKAPPTAKPADTITLTLDVANTGGMDGDEIVQLYARELDAPAEKKRPLKQLKGFQRLSIPKGATRPVKLTLPIASLGFWDPATRKYLVDTGKYELQVGASSEDIRLKAEISIR